MAIHFNADEILEIAERIEQNGARFYRKAAEGMQGEAKDMLLRLAAMEDDHEKTFADMREALKQLEKDPTVFDPGGEQVTYLQTFADGHIFDVKTDPAAMLTGKEPLAEILHRAIGMEKDSIVFYLGIKDMVSEDFGRGRIDDIIREERGHMVMLAGELAGLKS